MSLGVEVCKVLVDGPPPRIYCGKFATYEARLYRRYPDAPCSTFFPACASCLVLLSTLVGPGVTLMVDPMEPGGPFNPHELKTAGAVAE